MNTERPRYVSLFPRNLFLVISVFTALVIFAVVPLFKTTASSPSSVVRLTKGATAKAPTVVGSVRSLLSLLQGPTETIATYSSDCTTPQSTFLLGEIVCAKTDSVDLNFQGGRWVHWLTSSNAIEYGSSSTTLITANPQVFLHTPVLAGSYKVTIAETGDISQTPASFTVIGSTSLSIYASDCTTSSSSFILSNAVCVKAASQPSDPDRVTRRVTLVNPDGYLVDSKDIAAGDSSLTHTFTLPTDTSSSFPGNPPATVDNRGTWRVNITDTSDASVRESLPITVRDPQVSVSDLQISKVYAGTNVAESGGTLQAVIWVFNGGPDPAENVAFTDVTPANTNFQSLDHTFGPAFICTTPTAGQPGTITCNRSGLGKDEASGFLVTYNVDANVASGTSFSSTVSVASTTTDRDTQDNTGSSTGSVGTGAGGGCTLTCPDNVAALADTVEDVDGVPTNGAHVTFSLGEPAGGCGTLSASTPSGSFFPVGSTPVSVVSSEGGASCTFLVTVTNSGSPLTIACAANVTVDAGNSCEANVSLTAPTTTGDNVTVTSTRSDGRPMTDPYPSGDTTVTWTATNSSGSESCNQIVTILSNDTVPPTITVATPAPVSADASCQAVIPDLLATAQVSDNCVDPEALTLTQSPEPGTQVGPGTHPITLTANDGSSNNNGAGNTGTVTVQFVVNDTTAPVFTSVPDNITVNTGPGSSTCDTVVDPGTATATDNCGVTVTRSPSGNTFPVGTTTITWTARDAANNETTATQTVTVIDNTPPAISCPSDITVYLPLNSTATSMAVNYPAATATDNCAGTTVGYSHASGSVFPVGPTVITATATDANGNTNSCTFTVKVLYNFAGFFAPLENPPTVNSMKAGQAAPVKFSLSGNKGLDIFAGNSPSSVQVSCQSGDPVSEMEETLTAGGSSLSYNATSDQYNYVWKTESSWKNTCRVLTVTLNDGTPHHARFTFK